MYTYLDLLNGVLEQLKLKASAIACETEGPFLVCDLVLNPGGKFKQIERYSTEIALALRALSEPLIYPLTKKGVIRMEVMMAKQGTVLLEDILFSTEFINSKQDLPLALGKLRNGLPLVADLAVMPHLLIGGATGSGKSIMLHAIINSLSCKDNVKIALVDPKRVEFTHYKNIKTLYAPIAKNINDALTLLENLTMEMENRFVKLEATGSRDIKSYKGKMPYIVLIIDELADLMAAAKKPFQEALCRLAQKSRACGIHIVAATQRPSVDVVTGLIKANFPARISCQVSSQIDSRTVLGVGGAEKLLGQGDSILDCAKHKFVRFKGSYVSEKLIHTNTNVSKNLWSRIWNG